MSDRIEFGNLTIEIAQTDSEVTYTFIGDVDEHFRQKDVPRIKKPHVNFVLEEINNFNSCGIREWIYLIRDIGELGELTFKRCSVTMIDQINMVPDSLGSGSVESFYAPYYSSTGGEVNKLIVVAEHLDSLQAKQAPSFNDDSTGEELEFDALEESYFLFTEGALPKAS
jgi:hypothetical protein